MILLTTEQLTMLPQSILKELRLKEDSSVSGWSAVCICEWNGGLGLQMMISGNVSKPMQ